MEVRAEVDAAVAGSAGSIEGLSLQYFIYAIREGIQLKKASKSKEAPTFSLAAQMFRLWRRLQRAPRLGSGGGGQKVSCPLTSPPLTAD